MGRKLLPNGKIIETPDEKHIDNAAGQDKPVRKPRAPRKPKTEA